MKPDTESMSTNPLHNNYSICPFKKYFFEHLLCAKNFLIRFSLAVSDNTPLCPEKKSKCTEEREKRGVNTEYTLLFL